MWYGCGVGSLVLPIRQFLCLYIMWWLWGEKSCAIYLPVPVSVYHVITVGWEVLCYLSASSRICISCDSCGVRSRVLPISQFPYLYIMWWLWGEKSCATYPPVPVSVYHVIWLWGGKSCSTYPPVPVSVYHVIAVGWEVLFYLSASSCVCISCDMVVGWEVLCYLSDSSCVCISCDSCGVGSLVLPIRQFLYLYTMWWLSGGKSCATYQTVPVCVYHVIWLWDGKSCATYQTFPVSVYHVIAVEWEVLCYLSDSSHICTSCGSCGV